MVPQKESEAFIDGIERKKAGNESNRANAKVEFEIPNNPDEVFLHSRTDSSYLACALGKAGNTVKATHFE